MNSGTGQGRLLSGADNHVLRRLASVNYFSVGDFHFFRSWAVIGGLTVAQSAAEGGSSAGDFFGSLIQSDCA
jgi:hypothetical protein